MDLVSGNFAGIYETEEDALRAVAAHIARFGQDAVAGLALGYNDYRGSPGRLIAEGSRLADLARPLNGPKPVDGRGKRGTPGVRTPGTVGAT